MYKQTRQYARKKTNNIIKLGVFDSLSERIHLATELSAGGCRFVSDQPYGIGKILAINMLLVTKSLKSIGKVVWEKSTGPGQYDIGVEFTFISPEDSEAVEQLISFDSLKTANM